jgi:hypothetical protein
MISTTIIKDLIIYFARFVPVRVRKEMLKQPQNTRFAGYEEVKADILKVPEAQAIPDFDSFLVSVNNKLVSDRVKNSRNFMLFIEYGDIKVLAANGVTRNEVGLSVSVACELNEANNDMLNEAMKMQRGLELMQVILADMQEESKNCGILEFVTSPVQVMPLDPSLFFGHGGWAASFVRKQTVI